MSHILACPRYPVAKLGGLLPIKYIEALEQNQKISSCCRHPENHVVEAWYSSEAEAAKGVPDIYIFKCTAVHPGSIRPNGERWHPRFCVGNDDMRPFWSVA